MPILQVKCLTDRVVSELHWRTLGKPQEWSAKAHGALPPGKLTTTCRRACDPTRQLNYVGRVASPSPSSIHHLNLLVPRLLGAEGRPSKRSDATCCSRFTTFPVSLPLIGMWCLSVVTSCGRERDRRCEWSQPAAGLWRPWRICSTANRRGAYACSSP